MTYIAYDIQTNQILCFITTENTINTNEVFVNFSNYNVIQTELEIPLNFSNYKVVIENEILIGFEEIIESLEEEIPTEGESELEV